MPLPVTPTSRSFGTLLGDGCKHVVQIISCDHFSNVIDKFQRKRLYGRVTVRFNVFKLMRIAAMAVGQNTCVDMVKVTEGGFNKRFILTMDDGYGVIARIPTSITGPPHYTTASEVATMDFLRSQLAIQYQSHQESLHTAKCNCRPGLTFA